jgi:hypothetical protein
MSKALGAIGFLLKMLVWCCCSTSLASQAKLLTETIPNNEMQGG